MKIERTTTPSLPLTKAELRKHANIHTPDFDGELEAFQYSAVDDIQGLSHCKIGSAQYTIYLDSFDYLTELPTALFPVTRINSVTYLDSNGDEQTLAADQYQLDAMAYPQAIVFTGSSLPSLATGVDAPINPLRLNVTAGYGDTAEGVALEFASVPHNLQQAIKHLTLHRFLNRSATGAASMLTEIPYGIKSIVDRQRKRRVW